MAKRRRGSTTRPHSTSSGYRPGFSRSQPPPPSEQSRPRWPWIVGGAAVAVAAIALLAYAFGFLPGASGPSPSPAAPTADLSQLGPPSATPLADPPDEPAGDGSTATIETDLGNVTFELFTESSPVAAENFINLASAGYYDGIGFYRIVPDFMIQGGDPEGSGSGGPGYTIEDEPVVGRYVRGTVAMARTAQPDSQGSQFFIVVADSPHLDAGGYAIFGRVTEGMEVVDQIVDGERTGPNFDQAVDPVIMNRVSVDLP